MASSLEVLSFCRRVLSLCFSVILDHSQSNKTGLKTLRALDPSPRGMSKVIQVYFRKIYFFHIWHQIMNKWRLYYHWETSDWIFVKSSIKERYNHNLICDKIFNTNIYPNFQDGIELRSSFLERYPKWRFGIVHGEELRDWKI